MSRSLHFQVSTSSSLLTGEGVPYLIDEYRVEPADSAWQIRKRELPLKDMLIDFLGRPAETSTDVTAASRA